MLFSCSEGLRREMGPPRPTRPKKPGRDGSGRRPRPPEAAHKRAHIRKGRRICRPCRMKPLQCFFVGFAGSRSVRPGRRGAASGAFGDSCPCNPKRLPPRARARKQRAGAGWPACAQLAPTAWPAVHRRFPGRNNGDDGRQPGSALDRGPPHWAGRAGLRALGKTQLDVAIVCTKTRSDGESQ